MKTVLPYLPALALCALLAWATAPDAVAVVRAPATISTTVRPVTSVPFALVGSTTSTAADVPALTPAGGGVTSVLVAAADPTRFAFFLTAIAADLVCCLGETCSPTAYDVLLLANERLELQGFSTWGGPVSCASAGAAGGGGGGGGGSFTYASFLRAPDPGSVSSAPPPPPPPPPLCAADFEPCLVDADCCIVGHFCLPDFVLPGGLSCGLPS